MTKMLKITLNGETFLADMLWDKAPEACKLFESSCPVESRIFSAKICDAEVPILSRAPSPITSTSRTPSFTSQRAP